MISLNRNFLFIHVPRTGGNSIQSVLRNYSEDSIVSLARHQDGVERFEVINRKYNIKKHSHLTQYKKVIEPETFKKLFKFSTIRNPWDRCISLYFSPHRGNVAWDRDDFKNFINTVPPISKYITTRSFIENLIDATKQRLHIETNSLNKPLDADIDFLMRFEKLNEDFKKVCEVIGIPFEELPHRNKSSKKNYTEYYDGELIELVRNRFSIEIKYGDYEFGE